MAIHNLGTMTNLSSCTAVVPQPWEKPFTKGNSIVGEELWIYLKCHMPLITSYLIGQLERQNREGICGIHMKGSCKLISG